MVGSVMGMGENNGGAEVLIGKFDTNLVFSDPLPPLAVSNNGLDLNGQQHVDSNQKGKREIVLGRNVHTTCLSITEPDANDESTGDKEAYMASVLARYRKNLLERTKYHLGYPYNLDFDYGALSQLQHFSINNLGDPFIESNYGVHSRQFEVGVLDWFARLWEIEKNEYWDILQIVERSFAGWDSVRFSETHYSVFKAARMYRMDCVKVGTLISGEIDCADLRVKLLANKDKPAILNVNIGTTVKGAVDDLDLVIQTLNECGFSKDRFYIHCDGALFGLMMPFVKRELDIAIQFGSWFDRLMTDQNSNTPRFTGKAPRGFTLPHSGSPEMKAIIKLLYFVLAPKVSFKKPIGSVSVSGHKFVGCPMPCGVQLTRLEHINALSSNVEYLASRDATIMEVGMAMLLFSFGTRLTEKAIKVSKRKFRSVSEMHTT
ncbi:hypothetical protein Csa_022669 [Cucumis sativus]|nr:hypothetical protein Csa_022669 [Cucumis sativus]